MKEVKFIEAKHLLKPSIGQGTIALDSSISRERVESILATTMANSIGDIWAVLQVFKNYIATFPYFVMK